MSQPPHPAPPYPAIHAVLFDYGLVLTGPPLPSAWAAMRSITGFDESTLHDAYWAPRHDYDRGYLTGEQYWAAACAARTPAPTPAEIEALVQADTALWTQVNQPMVDWATRLHDAHTPTGILSNLGDRMTEGVLDRLPWMLHFGYRLFSHTVKLAKPDPAIYRIAAAGLQTDPAHILFIDDREENITGALATGMQAIRYTGHPGFEQELHARGLDDLWHQGRSAI